MKPDWGRLARFGATGVANTLVDAAVFGALTLVAGAPAWLAQIGGYACGTANSWLLNSVWVFRRAAGPRPDAALPRFLAVTAAVIGLTAGLTALLVDIMGVPVLYSKVVTTGAGMVLNYTLYRLVVFISPPARPAGEADGPDSGSR